MNRIERMWRRFSMSHSNSCNTSKDADDSSDSVPCHTEQVFKLFNNYDETDTGRRASMSNAPFKILGKTRLKRSIEIAIENRERQRLLMMSSEQTSQGDHHHMNDGEQCDSKTFCQDESKDSEESFNTCSRTISDHHTEKNSMSFMRRKSTALINQVSFNDAYEVHEQVGSGRYGAIKLAVHKKSNQKVAIKFFLRDEVRQADFIKEYNNSYFLSPHPNVMDTYQGMWQTDDMSAYFFVQEHCPYGSLGQLVQQSLSGIGNSQTFTIMLKVLSAIEFMHSENLVHRNIRAENVMIFDAENLHKVKITDFGLTRKVNTTVKFMEDMDSYQAPELCDMMINEVLKVETSVDIWSIGILCYYCMKGRFPWQRATIMCKQYYEWEQWVRQKKGQLPKRWESFNDEAIKFFKKTMHPRRESRWCVKSMQSYLKKEKFIGQ